MRRHPFGRPEGCCDWFATENNNQNVEDEQHSIHAESHADPKAEARLNRELQVESKECCSDYEVQHSIVDYGGDEEPLYRLADITSRVAPNEL